MLARRAMATRFEIVLYGDDPAALRAAGEAALDEIERLENRLSLYRPGSEIAQVNARAAHQPVRVTREVFAFLELARRCYEQTDGAFDPTIAPLVRCWGFMSNQPVRPPSPGELEAARHCVGMHLVELDAARQTVRFLRPGMMLDPGAIGKGYAIERAVELLREAGVSSALVHGGTSTIYGLGAPPGQPAWTVAIEQPAPRLPANEIPPLPRVQLRDQALSVSAIWGRAFESDGRWFGHVIDPRTGRPVCDHLLAALRSASATESDALSTALLVSGRAGWQPLVADRPGVGALLLLRQASRLELLRRGLEAEAASPKTAS